MLQSLLALIPQEEPALQPRDCVLASGPSYFESSRQSKLRTSGMQESAASINM